MSVDMVKSGATVLLVVLAAGLAAALPHWRGHNHHDWRSHHRRELNPAHVPAATSTDLLTHHNRGGFHARGHRRHHWPHHSHRWGHGQATDDQKTPQSLQLGWPHRPWPHHSPHWVHGQTTDIHKTSYSPLVGWPHRSWPHHPPHWAHRQSTDIQTTPQSPQMGWPHRPCGHHPSPWVNGQATDDQKPSASPLPMFEWTHRQHDNRFHGRSHHWPHWSRWNHDQNTAEGNIGKESQPMVPQINNEEVSKVAEIIEPDLNNNKDNVENKAMGEVERPNVSPQKIGEQNTEEIQQSAKDIVGETAKVEQGSNGDRNTDNEEQKFSQEAKNPNEMLQKNEGQETKKDPQSSKTNENPPSNADKDKSLDAEDNLDLHHRTKCQTINTEGKKIKLHNAFCFWPEEIAETDGSAVGATIVCEEKAIIPDVLLPDDDYFKGGQFEKRIECREITPIEAIEDSGYSKQTGVIREKYKHEDNEFAETSNNNNERVKVQDDKTEAKVNDATKEMPTANVNNHESEEKQSNKDDKYHVVLLQRAGETEVYFPQTANEGHKDKDLQEDRNSDNANESHSDNPKHYVVQDEKTKVIDDLDDEDADEQEEKVLQTTTANDEAVTKGDAEEFVESHSDIPTQTEEQEVKTRTVASNDEVKNETNGLIESISENPEHEEKPETTLNNYEVNKNIDVLIESISDSPADTDDQAEKTTYSDLKQHPYDLIEFEPDSPRHEEGQEKKTETPTKKDDIEINTEKRIVIISEDDDYYIRELFNVIAAQ